MANEYTAIIQKIQEATQSDRILRGALTTVLAIHKPRIFEKGLDAKGGKIGTYSKKPISIAANRQARNTGQTYFKTGYDQYKTAIGKNPGYVNLRNTDQMSSDYGLQGSGMSYGFGFQNSENYNKSQWMESKYDKDIFDVSDQEVNVLADSLVYSLKQAIG